MKFDLVSDLHVDFYKEPFDFSNPGSPTLVVAGDTSNGPFPCVEAIKQARQHYEKVLVVDGNHEHYKPSWYPPDIRKVVRGWTTKESLYYFGKWIEDIGCHFLPHKPAIIDNTVFIGRNGWYNFKMALGLDREEQHRVWKRESSDSKIRFDMYPDKLALADALFLCDWLECAQENDAIKNIVMVTHTVPIGRALRDSPLAGAYGSSLLLPLLEGDPLNKIKVWCFGHTHSRFDETIAGIRFVNHARGYPGERSRGYRPLTIEI